MKIARTSAALAALILAAAPAAAQTHPGAVAPGQGGFGNAVAVVDGSVLVGEPGNQLRPGLVYVYERAGTEWREARQLTASDGEMGDGFGAALAADGSTLLVGALAQNDGRGAVYAFERRGGAWVESGRLVSADAAPGDGFGSAVALAGPWAFVGAPAAAGQTGALYVFRRSGSEWTEHQKLVVDGLEGRSLFGVAVAASGERALAGAPLADEGTGALYALTLGADGMWSVGEAVDTGMPTDGDRFGLSVVVDGSRALVGAPAAAGGSGAVYVLEVGDPGWVTTGRLLPFDGSRGAGFGAAVAWGGGQAVVGAPGVDRMGAVYTFPMEDGAWVGSDKIVPIDGAGSAFGSTVAVGSGVLAVGLPGADHRAGAVSIFDDTGAAWSPGTRVVSAPEGFDAVTGSEVRCDGGAATLFGCSDVDLLAFLPVQEMGGSRGVRTNDVWGWTDPDTGREYALVGMTDQASFVDISDPSNPVYVGRLPLTEGANPSVWRDIKVYRDHAYVVSDGAGQHGMQVFDLARLRDFDGTPVTFDADAVYEGIASAHNVVINEETGFAYAVGARSGGETCGGGLHMIDLRDPKSPSFAGCFSDPQTGRSGTGYSHDAQCITYHGPDEAYAGHEICLGANETALSIADVTDKANPVALSRASYPSVAYSHQGWITDDHRYFYMNDELDEIAGVEKTRTLVWDISDLDDPQLVKEHMGVEGATDHNLYIRGDLMYQSNYRSGLRVLDISDPVNPREVAYFDTVPYGDNEAGMGGSWSNYPFFESGVVIVTSGFEGLFIVRKRETRAVSDA